MDPLSIADLSKKYGRKRALDNVSLRVAPGESLGVLGPNGAGKSTLFSIATGVREADSGSVRLFGASPRSVTARAALGVVPQETSLPGTLKVAETIDFISAQFRSRSTLDELTEAFGLQGLTQKKCGALSGGQKRRVMLALAAASKPQFLVLDEPTTGLDVQSRDALWAWLHQYRRDGGAMMISSHNFAEVEHLAQRVLVLNEGRVLAEDSVTMIRGMVATKAVSFVTEADVAQISALDWVQSAHREDDGGTAVVATDADALVRELVREDIPFRDLTIRGANLEEAFAALTTDHGAGLGAASKEIDHV